MGHFEALMKLLTSTNVKANSIILIKRKLRKADSKLQNAAMLPKVWMIALQKYYNVKHKIDQICIRVL